MPGQKIITLLAAATEIVCALGLQDELAGRSHECDYPEAIKALPVCTEVNLNDELSSREIDNQVKGILANALSVYSVKRHLIKELQPDIIITQDQCLVCAVPLQQVEQELTEYLDKPAHIISLQPNTLDDILHDITRIANALGVQAAGEDLLERLNERLDIIRHKLKFLENKPTVACIEWIDPLMIAGNWVPEMVQIAGGIPVLTDAGKHSPYVNWESIIEANPDVLILTPCGFSMDRTLKEVNVLLEQPGFNNLKAIKNNRFYIADGNQYFNRSGPRIIDSVEILAEIIHPKQFIFGYEGEGWMKFEITSP